jgi:chromosome segregation ATPase
MGSDSKSTGIGIVIGIVIGAILGYGLFRVLYFWHHTNRQYDLERSEETVSSQRHQIKTLRSELKATRTKLNEKMETIDYNQDVINRQKNEVASLNRNVESANQRLRAAQDHLTRSIQEAHAHVTRLEPFEREATNLRSQVGTLLRRQDELALKLRDTEQCLDTLRGRFQYVNQEVAERDLRLQTSLAEVESLRGSVTSQRTR